MKAKRGYPCIVPGAKVFQVHTGLPKEARVPFNAARARLRDVAKLDRQPSASEVLTFVLLGEKAFTEKYLGSTR